MAVYHVHVHGSASFDGTFNVDSANAFGVRVRHANRGVLWGGRGIILGGIVLFATTEIINYAETGSVYTFNTLGVLSIVGLGLALVGAIMVQASGSDGFEAGPLRGAGQLDRVRRHAVGPHFRGVSLAASPAPSPYRGAQFFAAGAFTF